MWSQLSDDVQAWDSRPENKNTYAAVLNIIELLQARSPPRYTLASHAAHAPRSTALSLSPSLPLCGATAAPPHAPHLRRTAGQGRGGAPLCRRSGPATRPRGSDRGRPDPSGAPTGGPTRA